MQQVLVLHAHPFSFLFVRPFHGHPLMESRASQKSAKCSANDMCVHHWDGELLVRSSKTKTSIISISTLQISSVATLKKSLSLPVRSFEPSCRLRICLLISALKSNRSMLVSETSTAEWPYTGHKEQGQRTDKKRSRGQRRARNEEKTRWNRRF